MNCAKISAKFDIHILIKIFIITDSTQAIGYASDIKSGGSIATEPGSNYPHTGSIKEVPGKIVPGTVKFSVTPKTVFDYPPRRFQESAYLAESLNSPGY